MSWRDREYTQAEYDTPGFGGGGGLGFRRPPPATLTLLILHTLAFFIVVGARPGNPDLVPALALQGPQATLLGILVHPFAADAFFTALFALVILWTVGGQVESAVGAARYVTLYVVANIAAGSGYYLLAHALPALAGNPLNYPVGALAACWLIAWQLSRRLPTQFLGWITTAGKLYAIGGGIIIALELLRYGVGSVGWLLAVAVGVATGLVCQRAPALFAPRPRLRVHPSIPRAAPPPAAPDPNEAALDQLLDKIRRSGLDSLTAEERKQLEAARQAKLRRH